MKDEQQVVEGKRFTLRQQTFFRSEDAKKARTELKRMVLDPGYNTDLGFSTIYKDSGSFVDKHMIYLSEHLNISVEQYLSNLRLKTKIRS